MKKVILLLVAAFSVQSFAQKMEISNELYFSGTCLTDQGTIKINSVLKGIRCMSARGKGGRLSHNLVTDTYGFGDYESATAYLSNKGLLITAISKRSGRLGVELRSDVKSIKTGDVIQAKLVNLSYFHFAGPNATGTCTLKVLNPKQVKTDITTVSCGE